MDPIQHTCGFQTKLLSIIVSIFRITMIAKAPPPPWTGEPQPANRNEIDQDSVKEIETPHVRVSELLGKTVMIYSGSVDCPREMSLTAHIIYQTD